MFFCYVVGYYKTVARAMSQRCDSEVVDARSENKPYCMGDVHYVDLPDPITIDCN